MNNPNNAALQTSILNNIHKVEGFDPSVYAIDYTDLSTGETRKRLPVMAQLAWFRLVYPEGKIAINVIPGHDCFVATARVYPSYKDPTDCYLAEATASRGYDPAKPSVSPVNGHKPLQLALHFGMPVSVCSLGLLEMSILRMRLTN